MSTPINWHNDTFGNRTVEALERNGFTAAYFQNRDAAVAHILSLVPEGASVGVGASQTERALGIVEKLPKGCTVYDHAKPELSKEEVAAARYSQLTSDVFLCSSNAVTLKGELVNTDATGNRVAAMIFGPKRVIVVVGVNKIVKDLNEADSRIKTLAAPMNNMRIGTANPCTQLGECVGCRSETRICKITTIISRRPALTEMYVIIIGEELGY